jgi:hypothetical protein
LKRLFQRALIDQILERPEHHGITVADWEALSLLSAELADETLLESREEASPRRGGAGSDAVIVAPGRDVPAGGSVDREEPATLVSDDRRCPALVTSPKAYPQREHRVSSAPIPN